MSAAPPRRLTFAPILTATVITVLLLWLFGKAVDVFVLLFIAVLISLYLGAVAEFFRRRAHLPERLAFWTAVIGSLGGLVGLLFLLVPPVVEQTQQLIKVLPNYIEGWEADIGRVVSRIPALADSWNPSEHRIAHAVYNQVAGQFQNVVPKVFSIVESAVSIFSVIVMSLYLALNPGVYREWLIALFPPVHRDLVRDVLGDLADNLRRYIVGQLSTMGILALLTAIGLYVLHVPYWLTFGVFTGAVAIVPFFGTLLSTTLPALFVLAEPNGGSKALGVVLLGVVIHLLEGNLISPNIMANALELPPVLTIIAVLVVGKLIGGLGLLIALPLLATVMVVVRRILINRVYEGQGFRRTRRDSAMVLRVPAPEGGVIVPDSAPIDIIALAEQGDGRRTA